MIPNINILTEEITETTYPGRTYKIIFYEDILKKQGIVSLKLKTLSDETDENEGLDRISGYTDNLDALKQAIYLILNTERYKHVIYSWDYGVELADLFGKPMPYVISEIPRRIKDALIQDDRIDDVVDFEFEAKKNKLHTTFTVISNLGNISTEMEVAV